ncbi:MAG: CPBP family intramembrane metalloprotease [Tissierella sp.]|nr:CPBP family intramembrane metalloprotease [Tissierella sp.]
MKEDIKRMINDFVVRALIYMFLGPIIMTTIRGAVSVLGLNDNIEFSIHPIWMILLFLLPAMKDLKVSPLETNKKVGTGISVVDTIALVLLSWSLYIFIVRSLNFIGEIEIIKTIIQSIEGSGTNSMSKYSPLLITVTSLINIVTVDLIFRGVLLNALRKYGDVFAIIVSSTMYALILGHPIVIPFHLIIGILTGTLYVLSNDIKAPIMFSLLLSFGGEYLREYMPNIFGNEMYFYGIVLIIASIYLGSRKDFRNYISLLKNQYRGERNTNKGKYAAAFKTEVFLALAILTILRIIFTLASAFMI